MSTARHFHVSKAARQRYGLSRELFSPGGGSVFPDLHAARQFTQKINEVRRASGLPDELAFRAGDVNAMALIDEVLHLVIDLYGKESPRVFSRALAFAEEQLGEEAVRATLERYLAEFPPFAPPPPDQPIGLEEVLMLFLANANLAFDPFSELFDDEPLLPTSYTALTEALAAFFAQEPVFGPDHQDLVTMLRSPARAAPRSLEGQLEYIRSRWGHLLGDLLFKLLTGMDLLKEEQKLRLGPFTPGPPEVFEYASQGAEVEAFSQDREWMPRAVMMARNALVWLDQLSRRYSREIRRLDQVPDEELDRLAGAGFTALWLIGVWERSAASREIKRRMGNQDAEASAYSLYDYVIADELGGQSSLESLKARAAQRGIRLASDMVPNHTGLDSRWMAEHPERFLSWPHDWPPFPSYSFSGPNLSQAPGLGVYLEDRYWSKADAAVVFKRVDFSNGHSRLIYHGNDGTHMPWNDTAQLDFLNPETREAVIQTILHVARMFPVIRFDAAMTLAKKHFQRLWYPEPGRGGDIPSRAGNGRSRADFDRAMPVEFWREVVDRVAREAPDTLLLAEAFWMLEGFFVRTLGMHRVYNSAFMHMLKDENNAGYRGTIKNTLEFDPEVLKRFVNFMSNPDEQTAIEQFGDGDKYFGVCTLMATLPGLPMFAHGQLEGLKEKYGMEFRRAYWNESPNEGLVARHEREIFPLLRRRALFAGVDGFLLYDFFQAGGGVNEDVFAYSNRRGDERGLVLYHNKYAETRGWIRTSAAFAVKSAEGKRLEQRSLADGLGLPNEPGTFVIFREHTSGLQFIRSCAEIWDKGLYAELPAYRCQVFLDFSVLRDDDKGRWSGLAAELAGRGVPSMDAALRARELRPVREAFVAALAEGTEEAFRGFVSAAIPLAAGRLDSAAALAAHRELSARKPRAAAPAAEQALRRAWQVLRPLAGADAANSPLPGWLDEWMLTDLLAGHLQRAGWDAQASQAAPALIALLMMIPEAQPKAASQRKTPAKAAARKPSPRVQVDWKQLLSHAAAPRFLDVHEFEGTRWLRKESLQALAAAVAAVAGSTGAQAAPLLSAADAAGYRWDELLSSLASKKPRKP